MFSPEFFLIITDPSLPGSYPLNPNDGFQVNRAPRKINILNPQMKVWRMIFLFKQGDSQVPCSFSRVYLVFSVLIRDRGTSVLKCFEGVVSFF